MKYSETVQTSTQACAHDDSAIRDVIPCFACQSLDVFAPSAESRFGVAWTLRGTLTALVLFVLVGVLLVASSRAVRADEPPGDSIYQLDTALVDQDGKGSHLADHRGRPVLVSMFYTSCQIICPLIIDTLQSTERALSPEQRSGVDVVMVSFDPDRDDPPALKKIADQRKLDTTRWTLARTDAASVRKLAAALDIQYRVLADGDINHATALILLDRDGRVIARTGRTGKIDPEFVDALKESLDRPVLATNQTD